MPLRDREEVPGARPSPRSGKAQALLPGLEVPDLGRAERAKRQAEVVRHYTERGADYGAWSREHLHFGYRAPGMSRLRLEPMLARMAEELVGRLGLDPAGAHRLIDLGCGRGSVTRVAAAAFPRARLAGVDAVGPQLARARDVGAVRASLLRADYTRTPLATGCADGVVALESACYATGTGKPDLAAECARLLRPGGRLAIGDGMYPRPLPLPRGVRRLARIAERAWAVETFAVLPDLVRALEGAGFVDVRVEDVSRRLASSVAFVPVAAARFVVGALLGRTAAPGPGRWDALTGPLAGSLLGLASVRDPLFGYYFVTATRG
jgi:MPBQ/MSBQ methyltransferase